MWIVTGGAGMIGSVLLWRLNQEGIEDLLVVDRLGTSEKWKNLRQRRFRDYLEADDFLERLNRRQFARIEGIIHLGAATSTTETDASFLIRNNFEYTKSLALFCAANDKRLIYASSAATYGDGAFGYTTDGDTTQKLKPLNMYGYSKHLFDLWALRAGLLHKKKLVGIKFFNIYGPNEYHKGEMRSVISKAFEQIQKGGAIRLFKSYHPEYQNGEQQRDFLYVKDAVGAVYELMTNRGFKGLFNLGSGAPRSWNALARAIFAALGRPPKIEYVEMPEELRAKYQYHTAADMRWRMRLKKTSRFPALEEGVKDYVQNHLAQEDPYL
jgi:ADP-L-glycero-D-manno-heptose 6-epimerase